MNNTINVPWPDWEIKRIIGRGSFGTVYEIERSVYGATEKAALKVISIPENPSDIDDLRSEGFDEESLTSKYSDYRDTIVKEYLTMSEMKGHPNVVYCDDVKCVRHDDKIGWDIYIKMELLTPIMKLGSSLEKEEEILKLGLDISNALVACQKNNLIHRDVKPQNIFVSDDGTYKLGDFGIAKSVEKTAGGTKVGTFKYMAPEVYNNKPYGAKVDQYSLGLVLYWLLNNKRSPFVPQSSKAPTSEQEEEARYRRFKGNELLPDPANGSTYFKRIVLKACAFTPDYRFSDAECFHGALQALKEKDYHRLDSIFNGTIHPFPNPPKPVDPPKPIEHPNPIDQLKSKTKIKKLLLIVIPAAVLIAAVAFGIWWFKDYRRRGTGETTAVTITSNPYVDVTDPGIVPESVGKINTETTTEKKTETETETANTSATETSTATKETSTTVTETTTVPPTQDNTIKVADVVGRDRADAEYILEVQGLRSRTDEEYNDSVAAGKVIRQSPTAGTKVSADQKVTLTISKGAKTVYVTVSFNANGGSVNQNSKKVTVKGTYGDLPVPSRDYYSFDGWYTSSGGGSRISGSSTVTDTSDHTLYAHWTQKSVSDWTLRSNMPSGAQIVEQKWTYTKTEYNESSSSSLSGWTQYDKERTGWSSWSNWQRTDPSNGVRNVESKSAYDHTEYHYYRWTNSNHTAVYTFSNSSEGATILEEQWFDHVLPATSKYSSIGYVGSDRISNWWVRADYSGNGSVDKQWSREINHTEWRYQEPVYTYYYRREVSEESYSNPSGNSNVSNVKEYVKYRQK